MKNKILSLLVLLLTAATGAWAQTQITQGFEDGMGDWTMNHCHSSTGISSQYGGYEGSNMFRFYYSENYPQYLISPEIDAAGGGTMSFYYARYSSNYTESFKVGYSTTTSEPSAFTWGNEQTVSNGYGLEFFNFTYDFPAGTKYVAIAFTSNNQFYFFIDDITIDIEESVDVTTNKAENETFFTEATFLMPTFDATAEYVIVRDMADRVTPQVGDGTEAQPRYRVKEKTQGEGYEPVDFTSLQEVMGLISVYDLVEEKALTPQQDFTVKIFKIDEQTFDPISADGVKLDDFDFAPGLYAVKAIGQDDSYYDGETAFSNLFQLVDKSNITFDPVPDGHLAVVVGETDMTNDIDENGVLKDLDPGQTVTVTPDEGYKIQTGGAAGDGDLTVYDGETTNSYVPVYGFYAVAYLKSEFVMPAADLSEMSGADISSMTFYASESNVNWGAANFQVFLTEVANPTISAFNGPSTVVYEGPLSIVGGQMTVTFTNPYTYNGGNLLVGVYNTVEGTYVSCNWLGTTVNGASVQGYSYSSMDAISATQRNFLPKTTFNYSGMADILDELTFQVPDQDTLVSFTLVRDMTVAVNAETSADSYHVVDRGNGYEYLYPEDVTLTVTDVIDAENPKVLEAGTDYVAKLQRLDGEDNWVNANVLVPDTFRYVIAGIGAYTDTIYTDPIVLREAYEVEVAAKSYITYYQKDHLTLEADEENAIIYTVASIEGDKAYLSDPLDAAPKETPLLIYNSSDDDQTFYLLSVPNEPNLALTVAPEFMGTLANKNMPGSDDETTYYVCNRHDFVRVDDAGTLYANRCWIQIGEGEEPQARKLQIVFSDLTGVKEVKEVREVNDDSFYDLNGRKVNQPKRKGVYIQNGRKVIVK